MALRDGDAQAAPSLWKDTDYGWWLAADTSASVSCGMLLGAVIASVAVQRVRDGVLVALSFVTLAIGFTGPC